MSKSILLLLNIVLVINASFAADLDSARWLRYTAISPDGSQVAFTYHGDIWSVAIKGGKAKRLTTNKAYDAKPVWSKDGSHIAFASDRYGNFDVYEMNSNGGDVRRLTFHSADDWPSCYSDTYEGILFNSIRLDKPQSLEHPDLGELYVVRSSDELPIQILSIPAWNARENTSGDLIFEEIKGYEDQWRKHHTSSVTRDIWTYHKADSSCQKLSTYEGENRNAVFIDDDHFYFLSEQSGSFNVFKSSLSAPGEQSQVTEFGPHPIRYLSVSNDGTICFSYNGSIYAQPESGSVYKLEIDLSGDFNVLPELPLSVNNHLSEMVASPNGKEIIFIYRGEVFATTIEGDMTRQLTHTAEQERSVDISPDGKTIVYAGERNNSWNLYQMSMGENDKYFVNAVDLKEAPLLVDNKETFQPKFSPDGTEVAYLEERIKLKKINIKSKEVTQIHNGQHEFSYSDGDQHFEWSPDGKWFVITFLPQGHWVSESGLVKSDGSGEIINLTHSGFYDESPKWSADGSMIYWLSDRHGAHSVAKTGRSEMDVYACFLTQQAYDTYKLNKSELTLQEEDDTKKDVEDKKKGKNKKDEDEKAIEPLKIEFDGLEDRKVRLTLFSSYISDMILDKDHKYLFVLGNVEKAYTLWKFNLQTKEVKSVGSFEHGGELYFDKEYKNLLMLSSGKITKVNVESDEQEAVAVNGEMRLDYAAERIYLMDHVGRQVKKKFLDPELHGADWDMMVNNYKQFVPDLNNNYDFRDVLGELLGELNASHTGARYYAQNSNEDNTASFGAFFDTKYEGKGLKIVEIMENSPLITSTEKIKKGIIIEAIDGQAIKSHQNFYPLLNRKAGKPVLITLFNPDNDEHWKEWVKPISEGQESELRYQRWIKQNRKLVHELSNNQIGYMHVRSMSDYSFREFLEEAMGDEVNKKALIVDTRFNGGGDLVDDLTTWLSGTKYMEFESNDGRIIGKESQRRWTKPSVMLVGEGNYSDAHCTPAAYKDLEIGKVIGMPVPGTCSFVWWERLQNGMIFGIPNMSVKDISGDVLENKELMPDIIVKNAFDKITSGEDQQIKAAVESLVKEIK